MAMAEDIEAFIAEHNLTQPTLIGHSMYIHVPLLLIHICILLTDFLGAPKQQ